ncbi:MAG: hypothetical protein JOZ62_03510, partial [Acidobacteriaceae bacterium]|nr:hypothetical protein [Acidobacteriaceae bacterium]
MGLAFSIGSAGPTGSGIRKILLEHFGVKPADIATAARQFPIASRVEIQSALEELFRARPGTKLLGIVSPNPHEPPGLAHILAGRIFAIDAGPLQHDEIDIGETLPVR